MHAICTCIHIYTYTDILLINMIEKAFLDYILSQKISLKKIKFLENLMNYLYDSQTFLLNNKK